MAIKNILVVFDGTEGAQSALRLGLKMALKYDAHITGLLPHGDPTSQLRALSAQYASLREAIAETDARLIEEAEALFWECVQGHKNVHWVVHDAKADRVVVENARYFDVTLIGQYDPTQSKTAFEVHPDKIALQSGRPIIIVPRGHDQPLGERAVVAWDGQRAAARALSDAMQILETKSLVTVLTITTLHGEEADHSCGRLHQHLSRHGVETEWVSLPVKASSVARTIVNWCNQNTPDLLVMGAYEHSKFREDILGGVTNSVLKNISTPILMAH